MNEVRTGDIIAGKFQVERVLGEGGMGYVVAARHLQLGQTVALKFMREEVLTSEYKTRFLREARNTVRLKSKHVSRVLDVGSLEGGSPYMVMEYLEGTDLSALLQKRGPFTVAEACDYLIQACEAIAEAHGHGIVHRDLKPANLFLTRGSGGEPLIKVLDFGVSKVLELGVDDTTSEGRRAPADSVVTKATDLLGSPSYMSPEQVISARDADACSDVWSLGVILFRLTTGKAPFIGNSLGDLVQNIMHGPMPNLRHVRPDIPDGFERVVARCMDRDRTRRPSAIELARLLAPYAGPNATPSLERIAILGPALVQAEPAKTPPSVGTGNGSSWTTPPEPRAAQNAKKDMSTASFIGWAVLFAAVIGSTAIIGAKVLTMRLPRGSRQTVPVSSPPAPVPMPVEPLPPSIPLAIAPEESASVSARPSAPPSARPSPRATGAGHAKPRSAAPKPPPTSDIPSSRE